MFRKSERIFDDDLGGLPNSALDDDDDFIPCPIVKLMDEDLAKLDEIENYLTERFFVDNDTKAAKLAQELSNFTAKRR